MLTAQVPLCHMHSILLSLLCQMVFLPLWSFFFSFFYGHAQFYIFSVFACEHHTVGIFFCLLSHQLSCSPDHAQQVFRSPTDEMKVGMEEKVEGEVEWVWLEEEKKRKSSAVKQKCVWNVHNRGRSFFVVFLHLFFITNSKNYTISRIHDQWLGE